MFTAAHGTNVHILSELLTVACGSKRVKVLHKIYKQVELGFSRCVKYVPTEFRVDHYFKVKGQMEVKVM